MGGSNRFPPSEQTVEIHVEHRIQARHTIGSEFMTQLLRFTGAGVRDPAIDEWMKNHPGELGEIAKRWFDVMRHCGSDIRELIHDGHPTACVDDAGYAYVNAFKAHVNVGFFRGAEISDPTGLLEGTGKHMRHVKLRPGAEIDSKALTMLIEAAYADMKERVLLEIHPFRLPG